MPQSATADQFGQLLRRFVPLEHHDIDEMLEEQAVTRQRLGQIALSRGWCTPDDLWRAWSLQLNQRTQAIDLRSVGIDASSIGELPGWVAAMLRIVPIRSIDQELIVAAETSGLATAVEMLPRYVSRSVRWVRADSKQLADALQRYYPASARIAPPECAARSCAALCKGEACARRQQLRVG